MRGYSLDIKQKKSYLKFYLGATPSWFDLRKKELINDGIDIFKWRINMGYLTMRFGTLSQRVREEEYWGVMASLMLKADEPLLYDEYLEREATPYIKRIEFSEGLLPHFLQADQDRDWFISGYADVCEFFYPLPDHDVKDFQAEDNRICQIVLGIEDIADKLSLYIEQQGKYNQTIALIRVKNFYRDVLKRPFLLTSTADAK